MHTHFLKLEPRCHLIKTFTIYVKTHLGSLFQLLMTEHLIDVLVPLYGDWHIVEVVLSKLIVYKIMDLAYQICFGYV